jgi:hypothetical protein
VIGLARPTVLGELDRRALGAREARGARGARAAGSPNSIGGAGSRAALEEPESMANEKDAYYASSGEAKKEALKIKNTRSAG